MPTIFLEKPTNCLLLERLYGVARFGAPFASSWRTPWQGKQGSAPALKPTERHPRNARSKYTYAHFRAITTQCSLKAYFVRYCATPTQRSPKAYFCTQSSNIHSALTQSLLMLGRHPLIRPSSVISTRLGACTWPFIQCSNKAR
eukprot:1157054-Pelagomonas_calceolata.AAC.6